MDRTRRNQLDRARRTGQRSELSHWSPVSLRGWRVTDGVDHPVTIRKVATVTPISEANSKQTVSTLLTADPSDPSDRIPSVQVWTDPGCEPWPVLERRAS